MLHVIKQVISHKYNVEQKKPNTKNTYCKILYLKKFTSKQAQSVVIKTKTMTMYAEDL